MRPKRTRSGECVYCGKLGRYSREHVIPVWVRTQVFTTGTSKLLQGDTQVRSDETLTLTVTDAVCAECNTGWMKRLGERVIPDASHGMAGNVIVLTPARARVLATWAVERALLFELALREHRKPFFAPASNFRWLYEHREDPTPPPGAQVFMAYLDGDAEQKILVAWNATGSWPATDELVEPQGYIASFSIGHLLFSVFGQDFREPDHLARDGGPLGSLELPARYGGYLVPLWPDPDELTTWPPRNALTRDDLHGYAAWRDLTITRRIVVQIPAAHQVPPN